MRLVAQTKLGFYPAPPEAVEEALTHLRVPIEGRENIRMLDPCCGEGRAIEQIRAGLGISARNVYACELDGGRAVVARQVLGPEAKILGPCSYMSAAIGAGGFGFAWVNPPFDDELGGGRRQEFTFTEYATRHLRVGGVLALVMPETAIVRNDRFKDFLDAWYDEAGYFAFPQEHRRFREVVYFGKRRREPLPAGATAHRFHRSWRLLPGDAPKRFAKSELTEPELWEALGRSPLIGLLEPPRPVPPKSPPMPPTEGHIALLLASGLLNGLIKAFDGYAFVVRGVARKVPFLAEKAKPEINEKTGVVTVKETWLQRPVVEIRAVDDSGEIVTFGEKKDEKSEESAA
jgi:hypothetical protein